MSGGSLIPSPLTGERDPQYIRPLFFREGKVPYALAFILSDSISPPMAQCSPAVSVMIT